MPGTSTKCSFISLSLCYSPPGDSSAGRTRGMDRGVHLRRRDRRLRVVGAAGVLVLDVERDAGARPVDPAPGGGGDVAGARLLDVRLRADRPVGAVDQDLRLAHAAERRLEAARPRVAAARLVALHDLDARG